MSYDTLETSDESSRPVELYTFTIGTDVYRYTSAEDDVIVGGNAYLAVPISRGSTKAGESNRDSAFDVDVPSSNEVAQLFTNFIPGQRLLLTVSRYQRDDTPTPTVVEIFDGAVEAVEFVNQALEAKLTARSALSALNREMPRYGYQSQCNHGLYDSACGISDTSPLYKLTDSPVSSVDGLTLTVPGAGLFADGWFTGGEAVIDGGSDRRLVLSHVGDQVEIQIAFREDPTIVTLYAGCAHSISVCKLKFDNVINFGGWAFVPTINPHEDGL